MISQMSIFDNAPLPDDVITQPVKVMTALEVRNHNARTIKNELMGFYGTEGYTRWSILFRDCVLTDGAKYLAERCGAYWLMDVIGSVLVNDRARYKKVEFSVAKLKVNNSSSDPDNLHLSATFTMEDGNDHVLYKQEIEYTDFPLDDITLYVGLSEGRMPDELIFVIMLTSEY